MAAERSSIKTCTTGRLVHQLTSSATIPKLIHFIWAGGAKPFPNHAVIEKWRRANPEFQVVLWVDKRSTPATVFASYQRVGYQYVNETQLRALASQKTADTDSVERVIVYADITENDVSSAFVRYEIDKLLPNYGASSDILRYKILYNFGGAYFDSDIDPGDYSLADYWRDGIGAADSVKISVDSQSTGNIGNDAIICNRGCSFIDALLKHITKQYQTAEPNKYDTNLRPLTNSFDLIGSSRKETTIHWTGPGAVAVVFKQLFGSIENQHHLFLDGRVTNPHESNDLNWMNVSIVPTDSVDSAVQKAVAAMQFESKHMGIARFQHHVYCIRQSILSNLVQALVDYVTQGNAAAEESIMQQCLSKAVEDKSVYEKNMLYVYGASNLVELTKCELTEDNPDIKICDQVILMVASMIPDGEAQDLKLTDPSIVLVCQLVSMCIRQSKSSGLCDKTEYFQLAARELIRNGYSEHMLTDHLTKPLPRQLQSIYVETVGMLASLDPDMECISSSTNPNFSDLVDLLGQFLQIENHASTYVDASLTERLFTEFKALPAAQDNYFAHADLMILAKLLTLAHGPIAIPSKTLPIATLG